MNHSSWILNELSDPSPLNRLLMEHSLIQASKEAGKQLSEYVSYICSETKFEFLNKIKLGSNQGPIIFYVFGRA